MLSRLFGISFGLGVLALITAKATAKGRSKHVHQVMDPHDLRALTRDQAKLLNEAIDMLPGSLTPSQWHAVIDVLEHEIAQNGYTNRDVFVQGFVHVPYLVQCAVNYVRGNHDGEKNLLD